MRKSFIPMYTQAVGTILHIIWCYILVFKVGLGIKGTSLAVLITYTTQTIVIVLYASRQQDIKESWFFPNRDTIKNLGTYLKQAVPCIFMMCLGWWAFEILTLMSGYISVDATAAQVILLNLDTTLFMLPLGFAYAGSTLVGNAVGEDNIHKAKRFAFVIAILCSSVNLCVILFVLLIRHQIAEIYTSEKVLEGIVADNMKYMCLTMFFDGFQGGMAGSIRAIGKQIYASVSNFIAYYIIALPCCYIFTFVFDMHLKGLWLGVPIGLAL
jgi:MATE family multidrug resistance protein